MKRNRDLLIVTRPDHALQIYDALLGQKRITFRFLTFKVVPAWFKRLTGLKRSGAVSKHAVISLRTTLVNLCKYSFRFAFARKWSEENILTRKVRRMLSKSDYKIIHYWPLYCHKAVEAYAASHPGTAAFADVHMPNPIAILKAMQPVYERYGIAADSTDLHAHAANTRRRLENAPAIMVPSTYVADTFRPDFPDKTYHVVTYGITVTDRYRKEHKTAIREFVYAGGSITLEKGCDLLCEYFARHPEYNLHLFGTSPAQQAFIFEPFRSCPNIRFHGHVAKSDLPERIRAYDAGIHLSRFDAYSLAVGEILGTGLPTIVSTSTGIYDDIAAEGMGLGTELDMEQIDQAVRKMTDPEFYNRCVDNIDTYIRTKHRSFGEKMLGFYSDILK